MPARPDQRLSEWTTSKGRLSLRLLATLLSLAIGASCQTYSPEFMPLDAAKPAIGQLGGTLADGPGANVSAEQWLAWLKKSDADIRQRLVLGEEDSLTNLLRFGVTYTQEYRIDDEYLVRYGKSSLVNSFAENRANDLIKALAAPNQNQGFVEMRGFR